MQAKDRERQRQRQTTTATATENGGYQSQIALAKITAKTCEA